MKDLNIAIIITGQLRIPNYKNFLNAISNFDIFISSYDNYHKITKNISENYLLHSQNYVISEIKNKVKNKVKNKETLYNLCQWWHLNEVLKNFEDKLRKYDFILKIRSDAYFLLPLENYMFENLNNDILYMTSDHVFYAYKDTFFNIYEYFFTKICDEYVSNNDKYFPIKYENLYLSYKYITKNPYIFLSSFSFHYLSRTSFLPALESINFPIFIFSYNNKDLFKNIENHIDFLKKYKNFDSFKQRAQSGTIEFGSEKYNLINALDKGLVFSSNLPCIGIFRKKNILYTYCIHPILKFIYSRVLSLKKSSKI